jgi:hypothetical protein
VRPRAFYDDPTLAVFKLVKHFEDYQFLLKCFLNQNFKLELLFRGTKDGFHKFHSKCDGHRRILTVIETDFGLLFGQYSSLTQITQAADPSNRPAMDISENRVDSRAFHFSLTHKKRLVHRDA